MQGRWGRLRQARFDFPFEGNLMTGLTIAGGAEVTGEVSWPTRSGDGLTWNCLPVQFGIDPIEETGAQFLADQAVAHRGSLDRNDLF